MALSTSETLRGMARVAALLSGNAGWPRPPCATGGTPAGVGTWDASQRCAPAPSPGHLSAARALLPHASRTRQTAGEWPDLGCLWAAPLRWSSGVAARLPRRGLWAETHRQIDGVTESWRPTREHTTLGAQHS